MREPSRRELARNTQFTAGMDLSEIMKVEAARDAVNRFGISLEDGLLGAMQVYRDLSRAEQIEFDLALSPVLGAQIVETIGRGSEALPQIQQQVDSILNLNRQGLAQADEMAKTWTGAWRRIGTVGSNTIGIMQAEFGQIFGPPIVAVADRFFNFILSHREDINNFFVGVRDGITPVIEKIWGAVSKAWPVIHQFASETWSELSAQWTPAIGVIRDAGKAILPLIRAVTDFITENPKLTATLLTGAVAWKGLSMASNAAQVGFDATAGVISLVSGNVARLDGQLLAQASTQGKPHAG